MEDKKNFVEVSLNCLRLFADKSQQEIIKNVTVNDNVSLIESHPSVLVKSSVLIEVNRIIANHPKNFQVKSKQFMWISFFIFLIIFFYKSKVVRAILKSCDLIDDLKSKTGAVIFSENELLCQAIIG